MTHEELVEKAIKSEPWTYHGSRMPMLGRAEALFFLVMEERRQHSDDVAGAALSKLRTIVGGANEPDCDPSLHWDFAVIGLAIALAKHTPTIWDGLSETERGKFDLLMEVMADMANFAANDANNYTTGVKMKGNIGKKWNPNCRLAIVPQMVACFAYFGSVERVNELLLGFDYDEMMHRLALAGFSNIINAWLTSPRYMPSVGETCLSARELLENGGEAYYFDNDGVPFDGGRGKGVKVEWMYGGRAESFMPVIKLLYNTYKGGVISNGTSLAATDKIDCYILDGTDTPYAGLDGMMTEFNCADPFGVRSDAIHCQIDFGIVVPLVLMARECGIIDITEAPHSRWLNYMINGNADLMYKVTHGYRSYSLGHFNDVTLPLPDKDRLGWYYCVDLWQSFVTNK